MLWKAALEGDEGTVQQRLGARGQPAVMDSEKGNPALFCAAQKGS